MKKGTNSFIKGMLTICINGHVFNLNKASNAPPKLIFF